MKRNEKEEIVRFKARLVASGFLQTHGVDYNETYSPVANLNSIRVFLSLCCHLGFYIKQFGVDTAFLNGWLEDEIYMHSPPGFGVGDGNVCRLRRSLYGLKQATAVRYKTITEKFVRDMEFRRCSADSCILSMEKAASRW